MGFSRRFAVRLAARLAGFAAATFAFVWLVLAGGLPTAAIVAGFGMVWAAAAVWSLAQRTNVELARFVAALDRRDLTQSFARGAQGSGFDDLGRAFDGAIRAVRKAHADSEAAGHFAAALVDGAPTPLLTIDAADRIALANKAARRLFAGAAGVRIDDYLPFGAEFVEALRVTPAGRRSTRLLIDGLPQRATLSVTAVERDGATWRIASVQIIQQELDQAEVAAQADLVRVLTHEIMNSLTPVTSLAASAARLMATIDDGRDPVIADVHQAIGTLARRAEEVTHFVERYREFARAPVVDIAPFSAKAWAAEVTRLFRATPAAGAVRLDVALPASEHLIQADRALLTQIVLNLMKNAAEALDEAPTPRIRLTIAALDGGRTRIAVIDNGPGIPGKYQTDVFLPFFTTKRHGTGVGLSFARQIALLHGGGIRVVPIDQGTCVEIVV